MENKTKATASQEAKVGKISQAIREIVIIIKEVF